jgi:DNA-binding ferritin-like protein
MDILSMSRIQPNEDLKEKTFMFLVKMMGFRNQLRMNHWQTTSYAEHKMTDELLGVMDSNIDMVGEVALGLFERPQINTVSTNLSDIRIASSKFVLEEICKELQCLVEEYKVTSHEGMVTVLGDFCAEINKFKYLSTLE